MSCHKRYYPFVIVSSFLVFVFSDHVLFLFLATKRIRSVTAGFTFLLPVTAFRAAGVEGVSMQECFLPRGLLWVGLFWLGLGVCYGGVHFSHG